MQLNQMMKMAMCYRITFWKWYRLLSPVLKSNRVTEAAVNVNSDQGDHIFFDECCILNCNLWLKPISNVKTYIAQLSAFKNVKMTVENVTDGFF